MTSDSRAAWSRFDPAAIPTKTNIEELHRFLERMPSSSASRTVLDLGCGTGGISAVLLETGLAVVHFTEDELRELLTHCGFAIAHLTRRREHSSRRPSEAAWFFYGSCRRSFATDP